MRGNALRILAVFWTGLLLFCSLFSNVTIIEMNQYLGDEYLDEISRKVDSFSKSSDSTLILKINSSAGDLQKCLFLGKQIADLKTKQKKCVYVYIDKKAVGPAALFPFIGDKIMTSMYCAWGDIPFGTFETMSNRDLESTIFSFLPPKHPKLETMKGLIQAMIDPHYQIVYEKGLSVFNKAENASFDPLILSLSGMQSIGVVDEVMEPNELDEKLGRIEGSNANSTIGDYQILNEEFQKQISKYLPQEKGSETRIGLINIANKSAITQSTFIYVNLSLKEFIKQKVDFVVLNLNTPGGEVFSTLKIVDLLQKLDIQNKIPVIAYVNNWAVSAGAMLGYSCRFIGSMPTSLMGAAEPVIMGQQGGAVSASEKINSALRAEFSNIASFYGRNPLIAEAMVDKDVILVQRKEEILKLPSEDEIIKGGAFPDLIISRKGKLLTLTATQLLDLGISNFYIPKDLISETSLEETEMPTEQPGQISLFKLPIFENIPNKVFVEYKDWRVNFFSFLTHPAVASLLLMGLIIGFYIEFNSPGFGIFGAIGLGCLVLILISSFATHTINWIEVIILILGLILLALELFIIPGFGIPGILGIALTIIGLFALMLPGIDKVNIFEPGMVKVFGYFFIEKIAWLFGAVVVSIGAIFVMARFFSKRFFRFSKLVLEGEQDSSEGYVSGPLSKDLPRVGDQGKTATPLRPGGKVIVNDTLFDGSSGSGYIDKDVPIVIEAVDGNKLIVKKSE